MDLQVFWDKIEPMHKWCVPESKLSKQMMDDLVEWIRAIFVGDEPEVLDIGCGSGRLFTALSKEGIEADVTMIDFVDAGVALCEENTGHTPDMWDGETLPYEDDSFDLVVMMDFLLHVHPNQIEKVIAEVKRVGRYMVYANTTEWNQPEIKDDTWCFAHDFTTLFDGLVGHISKSYQAKKKLTAYMFGVERHEKELMEVIEEELFDDDPSEDEREDDGDREQLSTSSSYESSVPDDREVG